MQLRYDDDFIEAAVFLCASGRRPGVPSLQMSRFHRERENLYRILDPDERNTAFFRLHLEWFREWGLEQQLRNVLNEFPLLTRNLALLALRKSQGKNDEGTELYVNDAGQRHGMLALRPERYVHNRDVGSFLRHEFTHLHDMLDPAFGYAPELDLPGLNSAQQRVARERYRLLWDITIDGRLFAAGQTPVCAREQHAASFARGYSFWTAERQSAVFESLWRNQTPSHAEFLALIADPRGLRDAHGPAPGASCPLCAFPTFDWAPVESLRPEVAEHIVAEFPAWTAEQGLCGRCRDAYEVAADLRLQTAS